MYRSILVPLDGSSFGEQALPTALTLARRSGATLHLILVHRAFVYVDSGMIYEEHIDRQFRNRQRAYLEEVTAHVKDVSPVPISVALVDGVVADAIVEQAAATQGDLIVMTTHGRGPLSRFWLGSVADTLIRQASVPLLLVRPREGGLEWRREPIFGEVLVPLDGSPLAEHILEPATALAQVVGAGLTLLRIVKPLIFVGHDPTVLNEAAMAQTATEQLQVEASGYLDRIAVRLRAPSLTVRTRVIVNVWPASAILEQSQERTDGVIALATHGRGGLKRVLLGSAADKVIRGTGVPVLVCRPPRT